MRHINIPIFIPHMGCPNQCVFCNQRSISGHMDFSLSEVEGEILQVLSTANEEDEVEIAFFGGSFTGIDRNLMTELLEIAEKYIRMGKVSSIRLSTRPDYISEEILGILAHYSVKTIELGLQSMRDEVLLASKRGHDAKCAERACKMIKERGFSLVGQMMIGLPSSTLEDEIYTAKRICELGADGARIYPTVVFYETELACMMQCGAYTPPSLDEAVERSKEALKIFVENDVRVIRVGLCASENLSSAESVMGGANHVSIGELTMSALYLDIALSELEKADKTGGDLTIFVPIGEKSKMIGQKRRNIKKIKEKYGFINIKVLEKKELLIYNIKIEF